jgi:hypothetical protein
MKKLAMPALVQMAGKGFQYQQNRLFTQLLAGGQLGLSLR